MDLSDSFGAAATVADQRSSTLITEIRPEMENRLGSPPRRAGKHRSAAEGRYPFPIKTNLPRILLHIHNKLGNIVMIDRNATRGREMETDYERPVD